MKTVLNGVTQGFLVKLKGGRKGQKMSTENLFGATIQCLHNNFKEIEMMHVST